MSNFREASSGCHRRCDVSEVNLESLRRKRGRSPGMNSVHKFVHGQQMVKNKGLVVKPPRFESWLVDYLITDFKQIL